MSESLHDAWRTVAEQLGELGSAVQERYREAPARDADERDAALRDAVDEFVRAGKEFGERLGDVAHDDAVKQQARSAMSAFDAALTATVEVVAAKVGGAFRTGGPSEDGNDQRP